MELTFSNMGHLTFCLELQLQGVLIVGSHCLNFPGLLGHLA